TAQDRDSPSGLVTHPSLLIHRENFGLRPLLTEARPAAAEIFALGVGIGAAERGVAVGEAAESRDDVAMLSSIVEHALERRAVEVGRAVVGRELLENPDRQLLRVETLGVLQRHVEETPFEDGQLTIVALLDTFGRKRERLRVLRKRRRGAAVKVSRHLVE